MVLGLGDVPEVESCGSRLLIVEYVVVVPSSETVLSLEVENLVASI